MNILIMTNTYLPHVGGVARSVHAFTEAYRRRNHRVLIVAPEFPDMPKEEEDVLRVPAIRRFNHTDFSVRLPLPARLQETVDEFQPDIIHSQHPFLVGATALRTASRLALPVVFTHHTMYEQYTHYAPGDSEILKRAVAEIATGYANLCDQVFAPSESVAEIIRERGVETPIDVVPTGVNLEEFQAGNGAGFRQVIGIPEDAFVVGHVGRIAHEKNTAFLTACVGDFMEARPNVHFLLGGSGSSLKTIESEMERRGLDARFHAPGTLSGPFLVSAYKAMNVFVFTSKTETQGMVLTESMAASTPVVALDAPGARDVVIDGENGRLVVKETEADFVAALAAVADQPPGASACMRAAARATAETFSLEACTTKALELFQRTIDRGSTRKAEDDSMWTTAIERVRTEWEMLATAAGAFGSAMFSSSPDSETS